MHRIALLSGGESAERDISINSGRNIAAALSEIGHDVCCFELQRDSIDDLALENYDFVFLALHGGWGEGGGVQRELEARGIPYSGSDSVASALALDKGLSKACFLAQRIPTPAYEIAGREDFASKFSRMKQRYGLPLVVKPAHEGSSIGISVIRSDAEIESSLCDALQHDSKVVIEQCITGREFTVAVIGSRAYPVIEIATDRNFYDFEAKYASPTTRYISQPVISEVQSKTLRHLAKRAHNALRCHAYSRVDIMMDRFGGFHVLEVNTLPGMTRRSLLPLATARAGMGFEETLQAMIDASLCERRRIPEQDWAAPYASEALTSR